MLNFNNFGVKHKLRHELHNCRVFIHDISKLLKLVQVEVK